MWPRIVDLIEFVNSVLEERRRDGEWQASLFADWVPGIERHPSFFALIRALER